MPEEALDPEHKTRARRKFPGWMNEPEQDHSRRMLLTIDWDWINKVLQEELESMFRGPNGKQSVKRRSIDVPDALKNRWRIWRILEQISDHDL